MAPRSARCSTGPTVRSLPSPATAPTTETTSTPRSGYGWRALVEADIARWKRVIGDGLRFQTDGRQATEAAIAADVLNRMLDLGRPEYVRIALPRTREGSVRPHRRSTQ